MAAWVSQRDLFARSQVNRTWAHFMGRGIVDPVDDFRATNPPSHPALLDELTKRFVAGRYDQRALIRLIMASRTYGLSSTPDATNAVDQTNYSHTLPRRLTAEQLLDAQHQVLGVQPEFAGHPKGMRAGQIPGVRPTSRRGPKPTAADNFLETFGKPPRQLSCDCERTNDTTLGQAFQLISGPGVSAMLAAPDNRLAAAIRDGRTDEAAIVELYWAALTRPPAKAELDGMLAHVSQSGDRRKAMEDVAWALLNSKEFVLRR